MLKNILIILFSFCLFACGSKEKKDIAKHNPQVNKTKEGLKIIPIYQKSVQELNNLSAIAKEVRFVALDEKMPVSAFHITDIALSKDYIFLMTIYEVMQFDKTGTFIRNIGKRGQGPREFLQLAGAIQLDEANELIYVFDDRGQKIQVYDFKGKCHRTIKTKDFDDFFLLLNDTTFLIQPGFTYRFLDKKIPYLRIVDTQTGKSVKKFESVLYPLNKKDMETYGTSMSCLQWKCNNTPYCLEYGSDTICKIENNKRIPTAVLAGSLKPDFKELFKKKLGDKLRSVGFIMHYKSSVFEANKFFMLRVQDDTDIFFSIYDKSTNEVYCTNHKESYKSGSRIFRKDYFVDDLVSGLNFTPMFQSQGQYINLLESEMLTFNKEEIITFLEQYSTKEGNLLRGIINNVKEDTNPILMIVKPK